MNFVITLKGELQSRNAQFGRMKYWTFTIYRITEISFQNDLAVETN